MANEDDIGWTITTGYYPELAAGLSYQKRKKGTGAVGAKYVRKRGFTDSSISREKTKSWKDEAKSTAIGGADAGSLEGKKLFAETTFTDKETGATQTYWKFRGGSEHYKLHGDQVWYMAGTRPRDNNVFQDYINDIATSNSPQFANVYSQMDSKLANEALKLAETMFDMAIKEVEKELTAGSGKERSAEEIGYKEGDFEYMSHAEAMKRYPHLRGQLEPMSKLSRANELDMVKIVGEGKNATIEFVQDVSEMDVLGKGQHGITRVPEELKAAIGEAMAEGAGKTQLMQIKEAVIKMYQNAIQKDYNPTIKQMKKTAGIGGKSGKGDVGDKKWDDVLKSINKKLGKRKTDKVSTQTIGKALGQHTWKTGWNKMHTKSAKQTSIEYIAHIMGSMNEAMMGGFKQSHRVFDFEEGGESVYATVPMEVDQSTWLFKPDVVKGTEVFSGYGATIGQEINAGMTIEGNGVTKSKLQKQAYSMSKVTGVTATKTGWAKCAANMGITKGARPATTVTIAANDKIEKMLLELANDGMPDLTSLIDKAPLSTRTFAAKGRGMQRQPPSRQPMFWALPYVGYLQSEYKE